MCLAMDANAALSQLSYEPKSALFVRKKLRILDFWNIRFSGERPTNRNENKGREIRSDVSRYGCEPCALPAELQAQIGTFHAKKVANFEFVKCSIFRGKSNKLDRKTGNRKSGRMCLTMDANVMLSQLRYRPKFQADSKDSFYIITDFPKM